jgi:regulatory protein
MTARSAAGAPAGERRLTDPEATLQHARDLAWAALNRREHTTMELRRVLERKRVEPAAITAVLQELTDGGWVDDAAYAVRFAEDRRHLDGWGSDRIERRLRALGIDAEHIHAALGARPAQEEAEAALDLLRRRFPVAPEDARDRNRALGVLVRKGYELDLALEVLRRYCGINDYD